MNTDSKSAECSISLQAIKIFWRRAQKLPIVVVIGYRTIQFFYSAYEAFETEFGQLPHQQRYMHTGGRVPLLEFD